MRSHIFYRQRIRPNGQNRLLKSSEKHVSKRFGVVLRYEREKTAFIVRANTQKRMAKNMGINTTSAAIALRLIMARMLSSTGLLKRFGNSMFLVNKPTLN
jgi:hypothetical protein